MLTRTMCHCRESKEKCETQVLPPEIWRVIAGHLGPCDWARAAGVCKATYHLQLDPVHIKSQQCEGFSALLGEQGEFCRAATLCCRRGAKLLLCQSCRLGLHFIANCIKSIGAACGCRCKVAAQKITLCSDDGAIFSSYKCQSAEHSQSYFATPKWLLQPNRTGH